MNSTQMNNLFGEPLGELIHKHWLSALVILVLGFLLSLHAPLSRAQAAEFNFETGGDFQQQDDFLHVDEAFILSSTLQDDGLSWRWDMPDGYYLYRHQFAMQAREVDSFRLGELVMAAGKHKFDEYFGDVEVYYHSAQAQVAIQRTGDASGQVAITYQGCADAGLCYAPETKWFEYDGFSLLPVGLDSSTQGDAAGVAGAAASTLAAATLEIPVTQEQALARILVGESLLYALTLFFLAGIGLAFTPCVLPMVPILSSIIVGEGKDISQRKAVTLSLAYVLGMALTYAFIGTLVGLFGATLNLQAALQAPLVLVFFAAVFVVLACAMFGFYELQLPQSWQNRLNQIGNKQQSGKHASVFIMGSLSSLVVSPCVSAPLAGALIVISTSDDAILGGTALLALGLGMGVPLLIVGASGGKWLPQAGAWMNNVKAVFGVLLLAVAIWLIERVVPASVTLALWGALLLGSGVYLGVLDSSSRQGWGQFAKALGAMSFLWGILLLIGASLGAHDPFKPLAPLAERKHLGTLTSSGLPEEQAHWIAVKSLADVRKEILTGTKPALLDLYADWCISCKVMERNVFPDPAVERLLSEFTLLRADVTLNDEIDQALMNHYGLFGPPSFVFFSEDGREITEVRLQGELDANAFAAHLATTLRVWRARKVGEIASNF